jgi:hypothetical protein
MPYPTNPRTFADLPVVNYTNEPAGQPTGVDDPAKVAWRLGVDYEDGPAEFAELFTRFLSEIGGGNVTALLIGQWGGAAYEHKAPVALRGRHRTGVRRPDPHHVRGPGQPGRIMRCIHGALS